MPGSTPASEKIAFPARFSPIGAFFVVVTGGIVVCSALAMLGHRVPVLLMLLIVGVMACCLKLLKEAVEDMGDVTIEWSSQGLDVHRLTGSSSYSWSQIDGVELFDPGGTFGDHGRHEEKRAAIGLYLRDPERKQRPALPDVMVVSRAGEAADKIPKLCERLSHAKRFAGGKDARRLGGHAASPVAGRAVKSFRRTATAASA